MEYKLNDIVYVLDSTGKEVEAKIVAGGYNSNLEKVFYLKNYTDNIDNYCYDDRNYINIIEWLNANRFNIADELTDYQLENLETRILKPERRTFLLRPVGGLSTPWWTSDLFIDKNIDDFEYL